MKKVLMIAYYFPPLQDVGVLRTVNFCKYLPSFGWKPYVLTVKNPDLSYCELGKEKTIFTGVIVHRSISLFNLNRFFSKIDTLIYRMIKLLGIPMKKNLLRHLICIPDIFMGWIPLTFLKARKIIMKEDINIIYASCRPVSAALIGVFLKKLTKKPLVLDFRDPWRWNLVFKYKGVKENFENSPLKIREWLDRLLEGWALKNASTLILATEDTKKMYVQEYPAINDKIRVVYNGYSDNFAPKADVKPFEKFTMLYTGNFYFYADPSDAIFSVIQRLQKKGVLNLDNFQFLFLGKYGKWLPDLIEKYQLAGLVHILGSVPRPTVNEYMHKSSLLFIRLFSPCVNLSVKAFEGLAVGIPILATIEDGEQSQLLREYSVASYIISPDDEKGIEEAIIDAFKKWDKGELKKSADNRYLKKFGPMNLTGELVNILNSLILRH